MTAPHHNPLRCLWLCAVILSKGKIHQQLQPMQQLVVDPIHPTYCCSVGQFNTANPSEVIFYALPRKRIKHEDNASCTSPGFSSPGSMLQMHTAILCTGSKGLPAHSSAAKGSSHLPMFSSSTTSAQALLGLMPAAGPPMLHSPEAHEKPLSSPQLGCRHLSLLSGQEKTCSSTSWHRGTGRAFPNLCIP